MVAPERSNEELCILAQQGDEGACLQLLEQHPQQHGKHKRKQELHWDTPGEILHAVVSHRKPSLYDLHKMIAPLLLEVNNRCFTIYFLEASTLLHTMCIEKGASCAGYNPFLIPGSPGLLCAGGSGINPCNGAGNGMKAED